MYQINRLIVFAIGLSFILLFVENNAFAQTEPFLKIRSQECFENEDGVNCRLLVSVFNTNHSLESNTNDHPIVQVIEGDTYLSSAEIVPLQYDIVLLLDASGSMSGTEQSMIAAATGALENLPEGSNVSVFAFNDRQNGVLLQQLHGFTTDKSQIEQAIQSLSPQLYSGTCLFDATSDAITLLQNQGTTPNSQRAVILFTDGEDLTMSGTPCSNKSISDVSHQLKNSSHSVQIHSIGFGDKAAIGDLNQLAVVSNGITIAGGQDDLSSMFNAVFSELNNQFLVTTTMQPTAGEHTAAIVMQLEDGIFLTDAFTFFASKDYALRPNIFSIQTLQFAKQTDLTAAEIIVHFESPIDFGQIILEVFKTQDDIQILNKFQEITLGKQTASFPTALLNPGESYRLRVCAVNTAQIIIVDDEGEQLCDVKEFVNPLNDLGFQILTVQRIGEKNLSARIHFDNFEMLAGKRLRAYFVNGNNLVDSIVENVAIIEHQFISLPFPQSLRDEEGEDFKLVVEVVENSRDVDVILGTATYEFGFIPVPPPSFWVRLNSALTENLLAPVAIGLIALSSAGYVVISTYIRNNKEQLPSHLETPDSFNIDDSQINLIQQPLPSNSETAESFNNDDSQINPIQQQVTLPEQIIIPNGATNPRIDIEIVESPQAQRLGEKIHVTDFPFTIGRNGTNLELSDQKISRVHAEIFLSNNQITLIDRNSTNGSSVNGRILQANVPEPLPSHSIVTVTLGTQTKLLIQTYQSSSLNGSEPSVNPFWGDEDTRYHSLVQGG